MGRWLGVPDTSTNTILPNIVNFNTPYLPLYPG
jgi:hypothetical protein